MRRPLIVLCVLAACHSAAPVREKATAPIRRAITAGTLDSLPDLVATDGRLVCLSDGISPCPAGVAIANWLHDGRFATWEPRRQVQIWSPGQPDPQTLGEVGTTDSQYGAVMSVAADGKGYLVLDAQGLHVLRYDSKGRFASSMPIPRVGLERAIGFSGDVAFAQVIHSPAPDSQTDFEVRELDTPGDTIGQVVLHLPLPWLRLRDNRPTIALPLFPTLPSYAIASDSDIVWSVGDLFSVRRDSPAGAVRWSLTSDVPGPAISPDEIAALRAQAVAEKDPRATASFDSSAAHTGKFHPAISGLLVAHDGQVLVLGGQVTSRDSVELYLLDATGNPVGRFALPRRTRVLLFGGDSLLTQRPGANMGQELRWLVIKRA